MPRNLFISYSHSDNSAENMWLERLKGFLDALQEELPLKIWEDTQIPYGADWHKSIEEAIKQSAAAILLVGPGFLASKFIKENELPNLLPQDTGVSKIHVYILYVAYCPWEGTVLARYQAFNKPGEPLEDMNKPTQNKWLNNLCVAIKKDLESKGIVEEKTKPVNELYPAMQVIKDHLETTKKAFDTQISRVQKLVGSVRNRLKIDEHLQYEQFFFRYYNSMNEEELFEFSQVRALTEGLLFESNNSIFQVIESHPTLRDALPVLGALKIHLIIWLNKYKKIFTNNIKMAICFTGVEDGVPFPFGVDEQVADWLKLNKQ